MKAKKEKFHVQGMSCAACASSAQTILGSVEGVEKVEVNYANATAWIEFNPQITGFDTLNKNLRKAGYSLEKDERYSLDQKKQRHRSELNRSLNRVILAAIFTIPIVLISMVFPGFDGDEWLLLLLTIPVIGWFGNQFYIIAFRRARHGQTNMDTLVALGTGMAFLYSLFNTIFPEILIRQGITPHVYYESAVVIITFVLMGRYLEERAKARTGESIEKLMGLKAKNAIRVNGGKEIIVPIEEVSIGDHIRVKPGEKIPVDGTILTGRSQIDESMITGESMPVDRGPGEMIIGATQNLTGSFVMVAESVGLQTLLSRIIQQVEQAQGSKAPVQKLADRIASIFVPVIITIALATFILWLLAGPEPEITYAMINTIAVLVIACPCALGLATPTAVMVGIGLAASRGILIRDAETIEKVNRINTLVFDKTGTITLGKPKIEKLHWLEKQVDKEDALAMLYGTEQRSEHPLARTIVEYIEYLEIEPAPIDEFEVLPGFGIQSRSGDVDILIGNQELLNAHGIVYAEDVLHHLEKRGNQHHTRVLMALNGKPVLLVQIADTIKESGHEVIQELKKRGMEIHLLTGDSFENAIHIAEQAGIDIVKADTLPSDKAGYIKKLQSDGRRVGMVGDGINDSPALTVADLGIAMGNGTDIAMESASVTLVKGDLTKIPDLFRVSRLTLRTIRQNLFWAFIYNILAVPVAAGLLYPVNGFLLNPMIAGGAMALSSLSVVLNSLLLRSRV